MLSLIDEYKDKFIKILYTIFFILVVVSGFLYFKSLRYNKNTFTVLNPLDSKTLILNYQVPSQNYKNEITFNNFIGLTNETKAVRVIADGLVTKTGYDKKDGWFIEIYHKKGYISRLSNLKKNSILVKKGDYVNQGNYIASYGISGMNTKSFLKFQLYKSSDLKTKNNLILMNNLINNKFNQNKDLIHLPIKGNYEEINEFNNESNSLIKFKDIDVGSVPVEEVYEEIIKKYNLNEEFMFNVLDTSDVRTKAENEKELLTKEFLNINKHKIENLDFVESIDVYKNSNFKTIDSIDTIGSIEVKDKLFNNIRYNIKTKEGKKHKIDIYYNVYSNRPPLYVIYDYVNSEIFTIINEIITDINLFSKDIEENKEFELNSFNILEKDGVLYII